MSILSKPGFLKWLVIVLLIVNAATLAYLFIGGNKGKKYQGPRRGRDFIATELGFNEEQKAKHDSLYKIHSTGQQAIFSRIRLLKDSLHFKSGSQSDTSWINLYTEKIGREYAKLEKQTFYHFQNVRSICTPQQEAKLDTIINRMNSMQRGPRKP